MTVKLDPVTLEVVEQLCRQGGGATVVYVVAGGLGDGADAEGLGKRLVACLEDHRRAGKWTPALVGPNGLGLYSPDQDLNTLFIPDEKIGWKPFAVSEAVRLHREESAVAADVIPGRVRGQDRSDVGVQYVGRSHTRNDEDSTGLKE